VARIKAGLDDALYMGNLEAKRDWGFAPEYVECMHLMLQNGTPEDFVVGTGEAHSVKELLEEAFGYVNLDFRDYVKIDPKYMRPTEVECLIADSRKARERLGWEPRIRFKELIKIMVDADLKKVGLKPVGEGERILKEKFPNRWWRID
jgi:GDPmannose 4,6-dehydratase